MELSKLWQIASTLYHTEGEYISIKRLLTPTKNKRIIDCSCGAGFPCIHLFREGFLDLTVTDKDSGNIMLLNETLKKLNINIHAFVYSFRELENKYKNYFDTAFTTGSSLTYCDSWNEKIKQVPSNNVGVSEAIFAIYNCINNDGTLIIGNSRLYQKDKTNDVIFFPEKQIDDSIYSMEWKLNYDWKSFIKIWSCKIYKDSNLYLTTELVSHLFDKEMLVEYCKQYFYSVSTFDSPLSPEYYVICKQKK